MNRAALLQRLVKLEAVLDRRMEFVTGPFTLKNGQVLRVTPPGRGGQIMARKFRQIIVEDPAQAATFMYKRTGPRRANVDLIISRQSAEPRASRASLKKSWETVADHFDRRRIVATTDAMGMPGRASAASSAKRARQYQKLGGFQRLRTADAEFLPGVPMFRLPQGAAPRGRKSAPGA